MIVYDDVYDFLFCFQNSVEPVMCAYKLVTVHFKWFGLQTKVEKFIQKVSTLNSLVSSYPSKFSPKSAHSHSSPCGVYFHSRKLIQNVCHFVLASNVSCFRPSDIHMREKGAPEKPSSYVMPG